MTPPKLKSALWVQAVVRRCDLVAVPAMVLRKGDPDSGAILVKLLARDRTCTVLTQTRTLDGELVLMRGTGPAPVDEGTADAYIERQRSRDPDLWVVEIEGNAPDGRLPFTERIV
jgi:hypothetical protein